MPISHAVWTVSTDPREVPQGILPSEQLLEEMIIAQPRILSSEWMLIGRQARNVFCFPAGQSIFTQIEQPLLATFDDLLATLTSRSLCCLCPWLFFSIFG